MVGLNADAIRGPLRRAVATAQNGLEVIRLGGLETEVDPSPFKVVDREPMYRLRRYFADDADEGSKPPVVLVPPMMVSADVYDVTTENGAAGILHDMGLDPWVVDFGSPDTEEGGWSRTLADHVVAISEVVDKVHTITGRDVHLGGYSQGGMFCYQAAAYRSGRNLASIITFGAPVDTLAALPLGIPAGVATKGAEFLADHVFTRMDVSGWMARTGFQLLDPAKTVRSRLDFLRQLHDRDALLPREPQRRFLAMDGWVAWSGPAVAELLKQFVVHNRMMTGGFVIKDRLLTLSELSVPVLAFVGEVDDIGQPLAVRGIKRAAPRAEIFESTLRAGHFGLVVGTTAAAQTWPTTGEWIRWREGLGEQPSGVHEMAYDEHPDSESGVSVSNRIIHTAASIAEVGVGVGRGLAAAATGAVRGTREMSSEAVRTLPRLARLGQMQAHSTVSLGRLIADQGRRSPSGECFLFDDRVHTYEAVNVRIDNVVKGLVVSGIRPSARIGVLMETRPSALAAVAALSRIGAVAVLLPPGGNLESALRAVDVDTVVTDPENLKSATTVAANVLVLGGGDARQLDVPTGADVTDLEAVDPDSVRLPAWFEPNPGRARELAMVLFTATDRGLEPRYITNHRWALSAYGTATAAGLSSGDTVYCLAPLHHSAGLLVSVGGALAGGSRIALSRGLDPVRFSGEVSRYGVTVISYTWAMMQSILDDDHLDVDLRHAVRLFIGSGMPVGLWKRTMERFSPARVLEFYASTENDIILANVGGSKIGSKGRPLPGSARVALAAYDPITGRLEEDDNGFVRLCKDGEVGLLLGRPSNEGEVTSPLMRGVFEPGDSWIPTENLFRRDSDGDFWLVDRKDTVVKTPRGPVFTQPIIDAFGEIPQVRSVVVYGVDIGGSADSSRRLDHADEVAICGISVRKDSTVPGKAITDAMGVLLPSQRPDIVHLVDAIPLGRAYRPRETELRKSRIPTPSARTWYYDEESSTYKRLTKAIAAQRFGTDSVADVGTD
ncbi:acyl-CoA synthetase [Rhodococcus sp. RS1C4]|uniref:AMP-binding protein n=1 Tax=Nocardiaceae TaxID=85025 RepID=UPI000379A9D1|nr:MULTISPECIES: AMP-binding protein [Rhodococcus]OZC46973.1 acyl-CoA synthetase [Rhodococcus sp. RS1C4]OZD13337.1 acyl-CoA synthetase [Rhodococcus sp. 06-156-4C]OZD16064.1 acyl-CoA synthetase [Rhodococcus sp. 06-156-3C]OZD17419.1 acyl-CoA synthetase [Rhodococcus sp. 06-156-4a]OZD34807.1 acyl-CoA synthetase [Rhodococcus sp. 06-156-3b]